MNANTHNVTSLDINFFEYCIIAEDTPLPAETVKVYIPKLTTNTNKGKTYAKTSILVNDPECMPTTSGNISFSDTFTVKTFSGLELSKSAIITKEECGCTFHPCGGADYCSCSFTKDCKGKNTKFIDGHIVSAYLPKGAQMIVCFMDNNINDCYLTNML